MIRLSLLILSAMALSACGEKPQELGGAKQDSAPYLGTGKAAFVDPGWKQGDKTSWEQHLRARTQAGQNDYSKSN